MDYGAITYRRITATTPPPFRLPPNYIADLFIRSRPANRRLIAWHFLPLVVPMLRD